MKSIKIILFSILLSIFIIPSVKAEENNLVNIYFFHSDTCPHCKKENELLKELDETYDNIKIYKYEINTDNNGELLKEVAKMYDKNITGVPFTIIGSKTFAGFSEENSKKSFISSIEYYSKYGYKDLIGEYLNIELPTLEIKDDQISIEEYISDYGNYKFKLPIFGEVETKSLTLPVISIVMGLLDGFNPCAMWVLLFLISMLIGMKNKKRMLTLGITFLVTSSVIYLLFMLAWLNVANLLIAITPVRVIISIIAIFGGLFNLWSYIKTRKTDGCTVVNDKKRSKIFTKIKNFTSEKNFILALLGVITLAISVNIIELACSAGLPIMFIEILSMNNLTSIEHYTYILIYILCFLLDDLIVFIIAMTTLKLTGISTKYGKLSKLIGGSLLVLIGLLLLFKPDWLMFKY